MDAIPAPRASSKTRRAITVARATGCATATYLTVFGLKRVAATQRLVVVLEPVVLAAFALLLVVCTRRRLVAQTTRVTPAASSKHLRVKQQKQPDDATAAVITPGEQPWPQWSPLVDDSMVPVALALLHSFVHYVPQRETLIDWAYHVASVLLGPHSTFLRSVFPRSSVVYHGIYLAHIAAQLPAALHWSADAWGAYMMAPQRRALTYILTLDGIVASMAVHASYVVAHEPKETVALVMRRLWLFALVVTTGYLGVADGHAFGQMSLDGLWTEYLLCAAALGIAVL
mmetsp:Transcript_17718/g.71114  ORF Transcript_17718/g.71114 Transcript_17718/m.71114 type:complete len:286 (+) Transcript_17718:52-909(+)